MNILIKLIKIKLRAQLAEFLRSGNELKSLQLLSAVIIIAWGALLLLQMVPWQSIVISPNSNNSEEIINATPFASRVLAAEISSKDKGLTTDFRLQIPKIAVNTPIEENVDPGDQAIYGPVLERAVAHGKYTRLPDEATYNGNVYLFAHRTGQIGSRDIGYFRRLDELNIGDVAEIIYAGEKYIYEMTEKFIVDDQDVWVYSGTSPQPTLTLQTCENGQEQRLIVKFKLQKVV